MSSKLVKEHEVVA